MPGTSQPAVFYRPFTKRTALMGTLVVQGAVRALKMGESKTLPTDMDGLHPPVGQFVEFGHLVPGGFGMNAVGHAEKLTELSVEAFLGQVHRDCPDGCQSVSPGSTK